MSLTKYPIPAYSLGEIDFKLTKFFDNNMANPTLISTLQELGLSKTEVSVYLALTQQGEASASTLAKKTNLPRTTVISILERFAHDGLITSHRYHGTTYFWIESPQVLVDFFKQKVNLAEHLQRDLTSLYRTDTSFPFADVYDTKVSIQRFVQKFLTSLPKKAILRTIDTPGEGNYRRIYGDLVSENLLKVKRLRGVLTRTLIPVRDFAAIDPKKLKAQEITLRGLPANMTFGGSLWVSDDLLIHFSGLPPFAAVIKHATIVAGVRSLFDALWGSGLYLYRG